MISIEGYTVKGLLYQGTKSEIYRAVDESNGAAVILKTFRNEYPSLKDINRFYTEYAILKKLKANEGPQPIALEKYNNRPVIILSYTEGDNLNDYFETKKSTITQFLTLAIKIVEKLEVIHSQNIIHKDINLSNILWDEKNEKVSIIDFGLATQLTRENQEIVHPDKLEGTIVYISPEQTGRINRSIDYRTDFYSLGITFYKMLTGIFPFTSEDPMELVHSHIAKTPRVPIDINPGIPVEISSIIMKLIAKIPEDRYQSLQGLIFDLKYCKSQMENKGSIQDFSIGKNDISSLFKIPEKLYGREQEIKYLMDIFAGAAGGGKELVLFSGEAGIGKTAVINEINKPILEKRGYFVSGKFEQYKKNMPYSAVVEAVTKLVHQLLTESDEQLVQWKGILLNALQDKGKVITDIVPALELLIGEQPDVETLPPLESQNRFNRIFQYFIKAFAKPVHPLVIFIDDLQWADSASLNLIQTMINDDELTHFLLILAFRDEEVPPGHPFSNLVDTLKKNEPNLHEIALHSLKQHDITHILSDTLKCKDESLLSLDTLVFEKTGGNPFFVLAFLESLYNTELIVFKNSWQWDIDEIKKIGITDNVVDLIVKKMQLLNEDTINIIKIACCIGNTVKLEFLANINEDTYQKTIDSLVGAVNEGIFIKIEDKIKFVHDKVREATYSFINDEERKELHFRIGKILLANMETSQDRSDVFLVTDQLNQAQGAVTNEYKNKLVDLNLETGIKAKTASAFQASASFFRHGAKILGNNWWELDYDKAIDYHNHWVEAEFLAANYDKVEEIFALIENKSINPLDKTKMIMCKIDYLTLQMDYNKAIEVGLLYLQQLGAGFTEEIDENTFGKLLTQIYTKIGDRKIEDLIELPDMTDKVQTTVISVLNALVNPAYCLGSPLLVIFILEAIDRVITYGNIAEAAYFFPTIAAIISDLLSEYEKGYSFAMLGIATAEKYNSKLAMGKCYHVATWLNLWKKHLAVNLEMLDNGLEYSLESGDNQRAAYILANILFTHVLLGTNLQQAGGILKKHLPLIKKLNQPSLSVYFNIWGEVIEILSGNRENPLVLKGAIFDEDSMLQVIEDSKDMGAKGYYALTKTMLHYLFDEYKSALEFARMTLENIAGFMGQPIKQFFYFFYALTLTKNYNTLEDDAKEEQLKQLEEVREKYKVWAGLAPFNYEHKYLLIEAEYARITGREMKEVIKLYDQAIEGAANNSYKQDEGISNECAAAYLFETGWEKMGKTYLNEAFYCYELWGCIPKTDQLKGKYPEFITTGPAVKRLSGTKTSSSTIITDGLDLYSVMKAANALAGEIDLGKLLEKMIKYVIENAGAEKGFFILPADGSWFIQAEGTPDEINVLHAIPVGENNSDKVPPGIIHYVKNSRKYVVLHDARKDGTYINDPYIKANSPKSILCMPLVNKSEIIAILYLENNLAAGTFTEERLAVLKLLSSQMAITIENASMFKDLDDLNKNLDLKVKERTDELQQTLTELQQTQDQLIESEKLAALGQLTAGVSHEINTPLGAINSSIEDINSVVSTVIPELPAFIKSLPDDLFELFQELLLMGARKERLSTREERKIKKTLKAALAEQGIEPDGEVVMNLAAMGVSDGVAHFLPLLNSSLRNSILEMAYNLSAVLQNTSIIQSAAKKASKVSFALKSYSHFDHRGEKSEADIVETVETVLTLYSSQIKHGIEIVKQFEAIPQVACYPDELNQVWTNIVHNAIQSMNNKGTITIRIGRADGFIEVSFKDTGEGIPDDIRDKIFNPFFTTRSLGEGSGLGLSIVKKIIEKHEGKIEVISSPGKGAQFIVKLPEIL